MQTVLDNMSFFDPPIGNTTPLETLSLHAVYSKVAHEDFKQLTLDVRGGVSGKKIVLPYVTPSGVFSERSDKQILSYSGIVSIDLDDVKNLSVKHMLISDPFLSPALIFVSPSGNGLKLFIRIHKAEGEKHLLYFDAISRYLADQYNLPADPSCKNISRACFLCYDPEALFSLYGSVSQDDLLNRCPPELSPEEKQKLIPDPETSVEDLKKLYENFHYRPLHASPGYYGDTDYFSIFNKAAAVHSYAESLLVQNGWRQNGIYFLRPGKQGSKSDVNAVFTTPPGYSIPVFYNFSTKAPVFKANKGYSPVQVIAALSFKGDYKECIIQLKKDFSWLLPTNPYLKKKDLTSTPPQNETQNKTIDSTTSRLHDCTQHPTRSSKNPLNPLNPFNPGSDINPGPFFQIRDFPQILADGSKIAERKKICGAFLYQDTTTLLFSRTNYGKSVLAFQFAYAAATGSDFDPCAALCNQCEPMKVLVIDLELDERVLFERHQKVNEDPNPYLKNLKYVHEKIENSSIIGFDLLKKIEEAAIEHEAKLLVIDNISKLLPDAVKPEPATMIISMLNRVRLLTGASILVIGHTTKGNPAVCVQPTDYYGSAMIQNFFNELCYLDKTKDGNFFLCHSKTKHSECYDRTVPVLSRGEHHRVGFGFTFCHLSDISDVQLPFALNPDKGPRSRNLSEFKKEISILMGNGISQADIARFCNVNHSSISRILTKT
jgi:hypothetical protein